MCVLSDRDRDALAFIAAHRFVVGDHVEALLDIRIRQTDEQVAGLRVAGEQSAAELQGINNQRDASSELLGDGLLARFQKAGVVRCDRAHRSDRGGFRVTAAGLEQIGSNLTPPQIDMSSYRHDMTVPWLWLAATAGSFGSWRRVLCERELRAADQRPAALHQQSRSDLAVACSAEGPAPPFGARSVGPGGQLQMHYPDLLLVKDARRVAITLAIALPSCRELDATLTAYGAEPKISRVAYVCIDPIIAEAVLASVDRVGLQGFARVLNVRRQTD
jgi:hypothetical protein